MRSNKPPLNKQEPIKKTLEMKKLTEIKIETKKTLETKPETKSDTKNETNCSRSCLDNLPTCSTTTCVGISLASAGLVVGFKHLIEDYLRFEKRPIPVFIRNEFITTALTKKERNELRAINRSLTKRILNIYTPNPNLGLEIVVTDKGASLVENKRDKIEIEKVCQPKFDALAPTNQLLWGTRTITAALTLYAQDFSKREIFELDHRYNVIWPWTIQYHVDRLANNQRLQYFPLIIVFPRTTKEVSQWIKIVQEHNLKLSIRSGGHSYEAYSSSQPVILDLSDLELDREHRNTNCDLATKDKQMHLCDESGILQVCPGVRLGTVYAALATKDRILAGGICSSVAIGGLVTGGGIGYFTRKYSYTCDSVKEFEIVLADGSAVLANKEQNSDLFRALKGGGNGSFGVITRIAIKTHIVKRVVAFSYTFDFSDFVSIVRQFQIFIPQAPADLASFVIYAVAGVPVISIGGQFIPRECEVDGHALKQFNKVIEHGFLKPLASMSVKPILSSAQVTTYIEHEKELALQGILSPFYKWRSRYLFEPGMTDLEIEQMAALLAVPPTPDLSDMFFAINIAAFGPGNNDVPADESVLPARGNSLAYILMGNQWSSPLARDELLAFTYVNNFYNVISTFPSIQFNDANSVDTELGVFFLSGYYGDAFNFLIDVKRKYDPTDFFQFLQSVPLIP